MASVAAQSALIRSAGFLCLHAGRRLLFVVATLLLWVTLLGFPIAAEPGLDASWQLVLNHAWTHHFAFGRELVFTYGPWGWLNTQYYDPATFGERLTWDLAWKGLAACWIVRVAFALPMVRRILVLAAALLLLPVFGDLLPMLVISGMLVSLLRTTGANRGRWVALGLLLGLLCLQKFSWFIAVACGLAAVGLDFAARREWRAAGWLIGSWLAGVIGWWCAAGQTLADLPGFLQHAMWSAAVYDEAMFFAEPPRVLFLGLATAGAYLLLVWVDCRRSVLQALLLTGLGLLVWKQSFVRADLHTFGFFFFMIFVGLAAPLVWVRGATGWWRPARAWVLVGLAVAGAIATEPGLMGNLHQLLRLHVVDNTRTLLSLGRSHTEVDQRLAATRAAEDLPAIRTRVGAATIDQFGFLQTALLFNRLNYSPRPVIQSYQACSAPLSALNADYYTSPQAPRFTLVTLDSIDGRFPPLDDSLLLPRLFTDHDYELTERGFVLLRHRPSIAPWAPVSLSQSRLRFEETFPLPAFDGRALWLTLEIKPSWQGWLRRKFYKPPEVTLVINDGTPEEERFRLIVPAARAGFLISPVLSHTADLERLATGRTGRPARSFRLSIRPGDACYFLKRATIEISALPGLKYRDGTKP